MALLTLIGGFVVAGLISLGIYSAINYVIRNRETNRKNKQ